MKKYIGIVVVLVTLVGCSNTPTANPQVAKCNLDMMGMITIDTTLAYEGDKVVQMVQHTKTQKSAYGEDEESIKKQTEDHKSLVEMEGITYTSSVEGDYVIENVTIDYTKVDISKAEEKGIKIGNLSEDGKNISLDGTIKSYEEQGMTCSK